ncbi:hypothetical protein L1049_010733 [Liquidambar formosana]|uniref:TIR domain-containing protein n=1 Tax=Liquidambar formosana TaxID=63359 RepID=A0AAP0R4I9_LIQFO
MQRAAATKTMFRQILRQQIQLRTISRPCDVFINHRGIDTKRTVAGLLYDHLTKLNLHAFLDSKSMKPGDRLFEKIDPAIRECKVGVAVFSPRYCESYFCLHELSLMMESKKRVIPIFYDVKPSELRVLDNGSCPTNEVQRITRALEEAKYTVGLTFDSAKGDWSDFLRKASDAVLKSLLEEEEGAGRALQKHKFPQYPMVLRGRI